ncbi:MAG: outer membrane beta-barrel protein [Vicingaceae bacterium]
MNKAFILILLLLPFAVKSQYTVHGKVLDTANQALPNASVVILDQSDSAMVNFGLTNEKGEFEITLIKKGAYLVQYSFLGYQTILLPIKSNWNQNKIQLPIVRMYPSEFQLSEVNISAERVPLRVRGDTLVYDALAFDTREGDDVEKLIELLPGISIDSEGNLLAQGKIVDKVLVNGKEFFGDDINVATKNLDARMVNNIEIFDKESENAAFTGINDGNAKRTINLELKEEYNEGSFGRLAAAAGTEETYNSGANYNKFNELNQSSVFGNANNINQRGFKAISELQSSSSPGITDVISTGLNINHEFNSNVRARVYYTFSQNKNSVKGESLTQNFIDSLTFETIEINRTERLRNDHRMNSSIKWRINEKTEANLQANFNYSDQDLLNKSITRYDPPLIGSFVTNNVNQESTQLDVYSKIDIRKKFEKKGRNWLTSYSFDKKNKQEETDINNITFDERIIQSQIFNETGIVSQINTSYSEPLNINWFIKANYNYSFEKNEPTRSFFDLENLTAVLNDSLSSSFQRILNSHDIKLSINRNTEKLTSSAGAAFLENNLRSSGLNRYFSFILPFIKFNYKIASTESIQFTYNTYSRAPELNQLITIQNNINPNQNYIGNPSLKPEFNHQLQINYYNFNTLSQLSFNAGIAFNKTINKIVTQTFINDDLTSISTPINTSFYESFNINTGLSSKIQKLNLRYRIHSMASQSSYDAFLNGEASKTTTQSFSTRFTISRAKREVWDIKLGVNYSINYSSFEVNPDFDQQASNLSWFAKGELEIAKTLIIHCNYQIQRLNKVDFFGGRILHLVDASITKTFSKNKWEVFLLAYDLFKQQVGIQRTSSLNSLSENTYNTRQQYFMVGVSKKIGGSKEKSTTSID